MVKILKCNINDNQWVNLGIYPDEKEVIPHGYHYNGFFWEKANSNTIYIVEVVRAT